MSTMKKKSKAAPKTQKGYRRLSVAYMGAATFLVRSESHPDEEYHVDLSRNRPHGVCGCPHYQMRLAYMNRGLNVPIRCKHIRACYEWCAIQFIDAIVAERTTLANLNREKARARGLPADHNRSEEEAPDLSEV